MSVPTPDCIAKAWRMGSKLKVSIRTHLSGSHVVDGGDATVLDAEILLDDPH